MTDVDWPAVHDEARAATIELVLSLPVSDIDE
jgi:hypothetical protein